MTTTVGLPALSSTGVPANTSGSDKTAMSLPYHNTVEPAIDGDVPGSIPDDNDSDPGDADDADKEPAIAADALAGGSDSKVFFKWASSQLDKFLRATNGALTKGIVKWIAKK